MTKKNENAQKQVTVNAQYIKDLSFENPHAPEGLLNIKDSPKIDVAVDVEVRPLQENTFEVILVLSTKASSKDKNLFLCEVSFAGVFTINVPEAEKEPVLMIYCPSLLFPFARRIVADITSDGGFPPLMLDPIDFGALYEGHKKNEAANTNKKKNK